MPDIELAKKGLEDVDVLMKEFGAKYYIDSGTLLGAYRDKNINPIDHDIDVRVMPGQIKEDRMPDLVKRLWEIGYRVIASNWGTRAEVICVNMQKLMLDLKFAFQDDKFLWVYVWPQAFSPEEPRVHVYPRKFFRHMTEIDILGTKYPCPSPIEEYIVHHYGQDWREFKVRPSQAQETDLTWDYMKSPPCSMSVTELMKLRQNGSFPEPATK